MDFGRYFSAFTKYASHLIDNINISEFAAAAIPTLEKGIFCKR